MAMKHCGVTTTFWVFLFPLKSLLEKPVLSQQLLHNGDGLPASLLSLLLPALPHPTLADIHGLEARGLTACSRVRKDRALVP